MGILADWQIKREVKIEPFEESLLRPGVISYGVSSYGYDVRVGRKFKLFTNVYGAIVDPKNFAPTAFVDIEGDHCLIPPNSFALAETVEYIEVPRDILCVCLGKSTYARIGIIVNVTPLEPEWRGKITIEISQHRPPPRENLRGRRHRPDPLPACRSGVPDELRRQTRQIPGPEGADVAVRHWGATAGRAVILSSCGEDADDAGNTAEYPPRFPGALVAKSDSAKRVINYLPG